MSFETGMLVSSLTGTAGNVASNLMQGRSETLYRRDVAKGNAQAAELNAQDAIKKGEREVMANRRAARQIQATQITNANAGGADAAFGSAADLVDETARLSAEDRMRIRVDAFNQAWGFRREGAGYRQQSRQLRTANRFNTGNTLLTGGMQAIRAIGTYGYAVRERDRTKPTSQEAPTPEREWKPLTDYPELP